MKRSEMTKTQQYVYDIGVESYAQGQKDALLSLAEVFVSAGMSDSAIKTMQMLTHLEESFAAKLAERA